MRTSLRGIIGLAAAAGLLGAAALGPAEAAPGGEKRLLGINLFRTWRDVLAKHGQPTRIEVGPATPGGGAPGQGAIGMGFGAGAIGAPGRGMGPTLPALGSMGMGSPYGAMGPGGPPPGMSGMYGAMMRGAPGSPYGGGPSMPGMPSMAGPARGGGKMGAMAGGEDGPALPGGAPAAMAGPMGSGGMAALMMGGPRAALGTGAAASTSTGEGEVTWIYERGQLTYMFLFNKDGRVIQIQEFGYSGGAPTGRGVKLGDPVGRIYQQYGWPDNATKNGTQLTLDYSRKANVAFQLIDEGKGARVVGITIAVTELGGF